MKLCQISNKNYKHIPRRLKRLFNINKYTRVFVYEENCSLSYMVHKESNKYYGENIFVFQFYEGNRNSKNKIGKIVVFKKNRRGTTILETYENKLKPIKHIPKIVYLHKDFYKYMYKGLPYKKKKRVNENGIQNINIYIKNQWEEFSNLVFNNKLLRTLYYWKMLGLSGRIKNKDLKAELKKVRGNLFYYLLIK